MHYATESGGFKDLAFKTMNPVNVVISFWNQWTVSFMSNQIYRSIYVQCRKMSHVNEAGCSWRLQYDMAHWFWNTKHDSGEKCWTERTNETNNEGNFSRDFCTQKIQQEMFMWDYPCAEKLISGRSKDKRMSGTGTLKIFACSLCYVPPPFNIYIRCAIKVKNNKVIFLVFFVQTKASNPT